MTTIRSFLKVLKAIPKLIFRRKIKFYRVEINDRLPSYDNEGCVRLIVENENKENVLQGVDVTEIKLSGSREELQLEEEIIKSASLVSLVENKVEQKKEETSDSVDKNSVEGQDKAEVVKEKLLVEMIQERLIKKPINLEKLKQIDEQLEKKRKEKDRATMYTYWGKVASGNF